MLFSVVSRLSLDLVPCFAVHPIRRTDFLLSGHEGLATFPRKQAKTMKCLMTRAFPAAATTTTTITATALLLNQQFQLKCGVEVR